VLAAGAASLYLQSHHILLPMIQAMRWNSVNYSQANRAPFGGFSMERFGSSPDGSWLSWVAYWTGKVPAITPLAALAGWLFHLRRKENRTASGNAAPL